MTTPTLAELRTARAIIRQQRDDIERSDNSCNTNGRITPYLTAQQNLDRQIEALEAALEPKEHRSCPT